ncbi:maestro heat-like repeat family member 5 [Tenrec ecaudatus]|uniref:maestro heat-like repeat family member 5 n=1 Tax=Tenrec ecaudatus TaxID=94439 RepID=UPI003F5A1BEA
MDERISCTPNTMKDWSSMRVSQGSAHKDRQAAPTTILLHKSRSSQAALVPQEHKMFMEEAYNAAICFKMLRDLSGSDPLRLKYIIRKVKTMAHASPSLVLDTIHDFFTDNPQITTRHKFRLFQVLEIVIRASDFLEETWEKTFMQLALDNMTMVTELEDVFQDSAGNVLVAICKHSWRAVAQHLEAEVLTGNFPHRSFLYVMGMVSSSEKLLSKTEKACWEDLLAQLAAKSVPFLNTDVWTKELLRMLTKPERTQQEQPPEKAFLFTFYGLVLQAAESSSTIRTHLRVLLETSHQWPQQREGIALTMGLTAARHLDDVWAVLEQFGRSAPMKWSLHSFSPKCSEDFRWKWASSTTLLTYGQMAAKAKDHILPWVDNILSRMIFYFHYSSWDDTLKQSFLAAVLMLMGAVHRNEGAHSYEFAQAPELLDCLMVLMEKECPDTLCTPARQQAILIASSLCKLRPPLDLDRKSRLLSVCLRSVFALPMLEVLEKHTCLYLEPPDPQVPCSRPQVTWDGQGEGPRTNSQCLRLWDLTTRSSQVLYNKTAGALDQLLQGLLAQNPTAHELHFLLSRIYTWLMSEKAHERQRAVHSCTNLLKFLNQHLSLNPEEKLRHMGQLLGMLGILCQDPDRATQRSSLEGVGHLCLLLMRHKTGKASKVNSGAPKQLLSSGDEKEAPEDAPGQKPPKDHIFNLGSSQAIKETMKHLSKPELIELIWTTIDGLGLPSPFHVQAAAEMLLAVIQDHGPKLDTVAKMGRAIHLGLCSVRVPQAKESALQAITLMARSHTTELVAAFLDFSIPLDSHASRLWRAMGIDVPLSQHVLATLLTVLQERPLPAAMGEKGGSQPKDKAYLRSLAAMNTLHELQFTREYRVAVQETYPELLLALLSQVLYVLQLDLPQEPQPHPEAQETSPSPQSTSLEALKSLLSTTGHWHDFAHLELQGAWELFATMPTYPQGVSLLARAMVQNHCSQIKAVLDQLLPNLQCKEERERKVAMLIFTEFLYSPVLLEALPKQGALLVLARSLRDPSAEVRVWSLQGLANILFHPEKGSLLLGQLPPFLAGFFQDSEQVVVRVMGTVSDVLHRLGRLGAGTQGLNIAINARSFFDDDRDGIRAAAMALFGDLVTAMVGHELSGLRAQVYQSLVPLLLHLKDHCPAVATQAKFAFYRCAVLLRWRLRHTLYCTLAWEQGLSARHFLWSCLMTHSKEEFSVHLGQALCYLHSGHLHIRTWAALFIGYTICYHPQAVSQMVTSMDTNLLLYTFEELKKDPEPAIREFAARQFSFLQKVGARLHP